MTPEEYAQIALIGCGELPFGTLIRVSDSIRAALRERDARWLAVAKEIEWSCNLGQNSYGCGVCQGFEEAGHQPDCALRALLEEAGK